MELPQVSKWLQEIDFGLLAVRGVGGVRLEKPRVSLMLHWQEEAATDIVVSSGVMRMLLVVFVGVDLETGGFSGFHFLNFLFLAHLLIWGSAVTTNYYWLAADTPRDGRGVRHTIINCT
jgi:hypothetical protein